MEDILLVTKGCLASQKDVSIDKAYIYIFIDIVKNLKQEVCNWSS